MKLDIWGFFEKSVEKIQVSLKSGKNKRYFTWRPIYFFLSYLAYFFLEWGNVSDKRCRENKNTHFIYNNVFSKIVPFMRQCGKNIVGHRWQYGAWALHAGYLRLQIHTLGLCNANYFSTATMVERAGLTVMLYTHCLSFFPVVLCILILSSFF